MSNEFVVKKDGDGDVVNFYDNESSSGDEFKIGKPRFPQRKKKQTKPNMSMFREDSSENIPSYMKQQNVPMKAQHAPQMNNNMYEMFMNRDKLKEENDEMDEMNEMNEMEGMNGMNHNQFEEDDDDDMNEMPQGQGMQYEEEYEEDKPSEGFKTIEEEKQDLLYKFYRMGSKGIPVPKRFNMDSDIHEMRREYNRIERDMEVSASIKFSRRMLMACVTGIEFLNKRYDPFDVMLDGWSESVMTGVEDYDNVFERLHDKYKSKVQMAPEIELLMTLAGSAFMFHLTNKLTSVIPNLNDIAKQNPDIINNMMNSVRTAMSNNNTNQTQGSTPPPMNMNVNMETEPKFDENGKREMRPPAFDISSLTGILQPPPNMVSSLPVSSKTVNESMPPMVPPPMMQQTNTQTPYMINNPLGDGTLSPSFSMESSIVSDNKVKHITVSETTSKKRGRPRKDRSASNSAKTLNI